MTHTGNRFADLIISNLYQDLTDETQNTAWNLCDKLQCVREILQSLPSNGFTGGALSQQPKRGCFMSVSIGSCWGNGLQEDV